MSAARPRDWDWKYFIQLNLRKLPPLRRGGLWRYPKGVWPMLFDSYEQAEDVINNFPVFANKELTGIRSLTIERRRVKRKLADVAPLQSR